MAGMIIMPLGVAWSPGIGDPSLMGWLTVAAYFAGASLWFIRRPAMPAQAHRAVLILGGGLLVLGINKLFNLSGAVTAWFQTLAYQGQWYDQRRVAQAAVILFLLAMGMVLAIYLYFTTTALPGGIRAALFGLAFLAILVIVRAASLHAVDALLFRPVAGIKLNWVLELFGIALASLPSLISIPQTVGEKG